MSTEYYLKTFPIESLKIDLSKKCHKSLINEHNLDKLWAIILKDGNISDETVKVINRGIRGPYPNGSLYCGFIFADEIKFWKNAVEHFSKNAWLNLIYAEYLVQSEKGYFSAHEYYRKAFDLNYRLIFSIEPSWRDELLKQDFNYELYYLRTQKDDYEEEDFIEFIKMIKTKYIADKTKIEQIEKIANNR